MNNNEQQKNELPVLRNNEFWLKLTDEEVWLRAYCAAVSTNTERSSRVKTANACLNDFNKKFRQNERT